MTRLSPTPHRLLVALPLVLSFALLSQYFSRATSAAGQDSAPSGQQQIATQRSEPTALRGAAAVEQLKQQGLYASLNDAMKEARYGIKPVRAEPRSVGGAKYVADNPVQQLRTSFAAAGPQLQSAEHSGKPWRLGLKLRSAGYGERQIEAGAGALTAEGQRIEYQRPNFGMPNAKLESASLPVFQSAIGNRQLEITEWYLNKPTGLEQGFTLAEQPGERQALEPLRLTLTLDSALRARALAAGQAVEFLDAAGNIVLRYDHLVVRDACGQALAARMSVKDKELRLEVEDATATYPVTIDPTFTQQAYLKASNTEASDFFGAAVAMSGDTVVVGAYLEDSNATGVNGNQADNSATAAGAAYVFVRSGTTWSQQAYLKASNPGASDQFGFSVAVAGNTVVVGANREASNAIGVNGNQADNSASASGAAYVFVRSGITWSQQAYLKASNTESGDNFGVSVGMAGDTVVVGANGEDSNATGVNGNQADNSASISGAAYVFVRSGTTWSQQAYLKATNTEASDQLGASIGVAGDTVVVGAIGEDSNTTGVNGNQADNSASSAGATYVFVRSGGTWSQQAYLKASNSGASDQFGVSVAVAGDTVVVGALLEDSNATGVDGNQADNSASSSGAAYVFVRSGTTWSQQAYLKASNTGAIDEFGVAVAVAGDTVVVGSHAEDSNATGVNGNQADNSAIDSGAAYIFVRSGTTWSESAYLKGSNGEAGDNLGVSIAMEGDTVVVGAFVEDSNATGVNGNQADNSASNSGAVYVISVPRTFVTNGNNSGPGSLRQAILDTPAGGTIDFDPTFFSTARTITLNGTALEINQNLTILGPGANLLTISGNNQSRVLQISAVGTVTLSGMTITGGNTGGLPGGGILNRDGNLTVSQCLITGNTGDDGGGILSDDPLTLLNSTVSNNLATLNGNAGGGISAQSTLSVTNSTISGNFATFGNNNGGGIWVNGNATITNSTITNNATGANGGGGVFRNGGTTTIVNTIIAGNLNNSAVADVSAAGNIGITSNGYNLIGNPGALTFGGTGDQNGTSGTPLNPQLGPLSLNGGPTPTHAPLGGSPALDKGNATGLDQRGLARQFNIASIGLAPGGNESDIGAVEMQALVVTTEIDPGDSVCDGTCTLRDAITAANANGTGLDDIIFSNTVGPTVNLLSALPNITSSISLNGPGANLLRVRRNVTPEFRIFTIANTGLKIAISGLTISDGLRTSTSGDGGSGSGIFSLSNLTLTNVKVTNNLNRVGLGGGVALANADGLFTNSTFSANTAGDTSTGGRGGGIFFQGDNGHKLRLVNSTVSGNNAVRADFSGLGLGGGIFNQTASGNGILEVVNSTIANNTAFADGGIRTETAGTGTSQTTLRNSIVANNTANNLAAGGVATITSQGFNLTSDNSNTFLNQATDKTNTNPLLGALANNGGPTQTHGLLTGSPALDAGHSSGATADQRGSGFARLVDLVGVNNIGDGADIGAYEAQSVPAVIQFSASNYNVGEAAGNVTITVTRTGSTVAASMVDFATGNNAYVPCNQFTGSAVQNCDFIGTSGTLTFAAGDTSKTFEVLVTDDAWQEGSETVPITLSNPLGATVGSTAGANVTILDNELGGITSPIAKQFVANLTGDQETPANNSTAKGGGVVLLNGAETSAQVSLIFSGLSSAQTTAKIHGPAAAGVAAPPLFTLPNGTVINAVINPTSQQVTDLKTGLHYLNVSSAGFTNGEIRGQLLWNPLEESQFFVLQHYYDFLQRLPDPGGFSFWQGLISSCNSDVQCLRDRRLLVSNAFFYEQEYQQTGAYVFRLYRAAYGNHQPFPNPDNSNATESNKLPGYAVFAADRARVVGGASLAQGQSDLANTFVTRPEFLAKYSTGLTGPQFVDAVLATLLTELGVNLATERTSLINLFNSGGRGAVMYRLADDNAQNPINNHPFLDEEYNRAFVATQYFGYLRRDADIGGFLFWLGQVNSGPLRDVNKQHAMVCSFNTSGEYQLRFGPIITRFNSECQ